MVRALLGDAGQGVYQCVIGQWRVFRQADRYFKRLVESRAGRHQILRQADALTLRRVVDAAGQHHVGHARHADQLGDTHRAATTDKDAARALREGVEGRLVGNPDVAGAGQLQPAADHGTMQRGHHRHRAELHAVERKVPAAGVEHALTCVAFLELTQVQPCAEMFAFAVNDGGTHAKGHLLEYPAQGRDQRIIERVAFG